MKNTLSNENELSIRAMDSALTILAMMFFIGPIAKTVVRAEVASVGLLYVWALIVIFIIILYYIFGGNIKKKGTYVFILVLVALSQFIPVGERALNHPVLSQIPKYIIMWTVAYSLIVDRERFLGKSANDEMKKNINPWK